MEKEILTTFEAARYCHVHPGTIKNWIKNENLQAFKTPGGHRRIYKRDLDEFLKDNNIPIICESKVQRKRVLIIDSDYLVREEISKSLLCHIQHYEVAAASNAFEAGEMMVAFQPDLVVLESELPGITAKDVCRRIKSSAHLEDPKIMITSSNSGKSKDISAIFDQDWADQLLHKPVDTEKLCLEADKMLGIRKTI
ncbi:MAG: response regulator [Gemmatimonadota bacterium]|nr:response regulator [Gemmatimonadota bacterium]